MRKTILILFALTLSLRAAADFRAFERLAVDQALQSRLEAASEKSLADPIAAKLTRENLSITVIDLDRNMRASVRGRTPYHPASVVKAFYLVSAYNEIARGNLDNDAALQKAMRDMIVDSSNDATAYIVDRITKTTGGPELRGRAWRKFEDRRNLMNRFFRGLGYDVSMSGKTWCDAPYGRELQLLGAKREFRNRATTDAFAALMLWIVRREAVSPQASDAMLALMKRTPFVDDPKTGDTQVTEFIGAVVPSGSELFSKAGWTSEVRHDAAYVVLPGGRRLVIAIGTRGASSEIALLPMIARNVLEAVEEGGPLARPDGSAASTSMTR